MPLKPDLSELARIGILSGLVSGFVLGLLLCFWNLPLILEAEKFEASNASSVESHSHSHGDKRHIHDTASAAENLEETKVLSRRNAWTLFGSILLGLAFGILSSLWIFFLSPAEFFVLSSHSKTFLIALTFGLSGFLIFFAIPALGLPPELPGRMAASGDYETRQNWWYFSVGLSSVGFLLFSLVYSFANFEKAKRSLLGLALLAICAALPFLAGVPSLEETSSVPEMLRVRFERVAWITNLIFWLLLSFSFLFLLRKKISIFRQADPI